MPFAGYENFAACMLDQTKKGHSEESARRICGKLQGEAEGEMSEEKTPLRSVLLDAMPTADGAGLVEIPIAVTGKWKQGTREFEITREDLGKMVANFEKRQNGEINVDYDHASEMTDVARGGPIPSAGRILKMRSNGALYAGIEFTARALELIRNKEYRYVSPAIDWSATDKQTGNPQGTTLTSLALTNRPFLEELPPIRLSEITGADRNSKLEIRNSERENDQGGNMEALTATKLSEGKFQIVRGAEVLGSVDIAEPASPKPEEIVATFTEKIGAKGKTEVEIKQLVESGVKFTGREAQDAAFRLLATECVKDGKLDRDKMKVLARDQKASVEQFFTFEDAWGKVDAAVKFGKILPKSRDHALRIALSDAPAFDALMADAKPIVPLQATGLAGAGRQPSEVGRPKNISAGKEVVNADRVARIHALQEQSAKAGKKLGYLEAHAIVLSEEQAAGIDGNGQAA
jgi:phage I-like protein